MTEPQTPTRNTFKDQLDSATWFKSSRSSGGTNCVEIAFLGTAVGVRDSKIPGQPPLCFTTEGYKTFISGIARGDLRWPTSG
ncbi:DUF397 domain-containing protein [Streptomyces sp. NPDC050204]|uniref:DUF397 domain-containing protein n=1 Tax=Streptomyces sp. NPDC050204 TaxID=3155514 RepID=UPI003420A305